MLGIEKIGEKNKILYIYAHILYIAFENNAIYQRHGTHRLSNKVYRYSKISRGMHAVMSVDSPAYLQPIYRNCDYS